MEDKVTGGSWLEGMIPDPLSVATPLAIPILEASNFKAKPAVKSEAFAFNDKALLTSVAFAFWFKEDTTSLELDFKSILLDKLIVSNVLAANCVGVT